MDFIKDINKETIIICKKGFKEQFLKLNILKPVKLMTPTEFIKKLYFTYDESAILYVMKKYNIKYDIAKMYLENIYYVEDTLYDIEKLDFLVNLKKELKSNSLLIYNKLFQEYVKNVDIILYDIRPNNYLLKALSNLKCKEVKRNYNNYPHEIIKFHNINEEVEYVAYNIASLIDSGISPSKIYLTNVDKSYYNTINRIFPLFNLKVNLNNQVNLVSFPLVREFLKLISSFTIKESLDKLNQQDPIYNELVKVINKYLIYDDINLIIHKIKTSTIPETSYDGAINIIDYLDHISDDTEYIFFLGFNDGQVPISYKDTEYITDSIKKYLNLEDTRVLNKYLRIDIIKNLSDIKNLTITYKEKDDKKTYYKSTLSDYFKEVPANINKEISYSKKLNQIKLASCYDEYIKYGYKPKDFTYLLNNYSINYFSYNNKYTHIKRDLDKLKLSYSKMQNYNKCAFKYYLTDILKLDIYEENFSTVIGSMVHFVLEQCLSNNETDIDKYVTIFIGDKTFTKKENFFLEKYKECIRELLNEIKLEKEYTIFKDAMYEKKIEIDYGNNISFIGIIDKVLYYQDDDTTYVALIDYKTGADQITLKYLKYGLNIQLPIYLYLSSKLNLKNIVYSGFYLQKFNITEKDYRLIGYSNSDKAVLERFDREYYNSKIIKGMKTKNDGSFYKSAKVLSNDEIKEITDITESQIKNVIENIQNNNFDINPKISEGKNISCTYCKFKDICFVTKLDEVTIEPKEYGGEELG